MQNRSEIDFLIACARPSQNDQTSRCLRSLLAAPIDWKRLRALAYYHRVHPLLYKRLSEHAADLISTPHLAEMAEAEHTGAARNLCLAGELITLTKAFARSNIPVLPHKGPLLAQAAYRSIAMRQFADLDLLVHPGDLPRSIALLTGLGYMPPAELAWLSPSALLQWTGEMSYVSTQGTTVDLHWKLTPGHHTVQLDPKFLWRNMTSIRLGGGSDLPSLTPEALLLLLAVHGAKHCWESIGWLADIAWLLDANPNFDWKLELDLAAESGCQRPLSLAASLAEMIFGARVLELHPDPAVAHLQQRVISRWYYGPVETPKSPELFSFARTLASRRKDSLRHLFGLLFHPTQLEWSRRRLPDSLFWLYSPGRAVRLFSKYLLKQ